VWERFVARSNWAAELRRKALEHCFESILYEQRASHYQALSPVNGTLNTLAIYARDPSHSDLEPSLKGLESWRWQDDEGIRYAGARSTTWDTSFALQALLEDPCNAAQRSDSLRHGYEFLRNAQMTDEILNPEAHHRDPILGGWCFSDGRHRWPVS